MIEEADLDDVNELMKEIEKIFKKYSANFQDNKNDIYGVLVKLADDPNFSKMDIIKAFIVYLSLSKTMDPKNSVANFIIEELQYAAGGLFIYDDFKYLRDPVSQNEYKYEFEGDISAEKTIDKTWVELTLTLSSMTKNREIWWKQHWIISDMNGRENISFRLAEMTKWIQAVQKQIIEKCDPIKRRSGGN